MTNSKDFLVVLGMHRSGTSAMTGILQALGVNLGEELLPPMEGVNPKGFFEHAAIVSVHEELLKALGFHWLDQRPMQEGWWQEKAAAIARRKISRILENEFLGQAGLGCVKDPRICRLLPLWIPLLAELGYRPKFLLIFRDPVEVSESIHVRDGIERNAAYIGWLRHVLEAEHDSREFSRVFITYDELLADWKSVLERVADQLSITWPNDYSFADGFIEQSLKHAGIKQQARFSTGRFADIAVSLYQRVKSGDYSHFDEVEAEFRAEAKQIQDSFSQMNQLVKWQEETTHTIHALTAEIENAEAQINYRDARIEELEEALQAEVADATAQISYRDARIEELEEALQDEKANATEQVNYRDVRIEELEEALQDEKTNATEQINYRNELIQELESKLDGRKLKEKVGVQFKASVIIPTKNGGELLRDVLREVLSQDVPWQYEVFVIDSGSSDGTVEYCRTLEDVEVHEIAPHEFGHGKTRNLAISMTSGEFVVLITQDAKPFNNRWLYEMVAAVEQAPDVAGAFGRHVAYPADGPFVEHELNAHFDGFIPWGPVMRLDDPERYEEDEGYRQVLHFFSDNNACLRRSVWEEIPYEDVDFSEDMLWAKSIIEAGYGKAYADKGVVYHSHDYAAVWRFRRSFDEAWALKRLFGYKLCPSLFHMTAQAVSTIVADYRYGFDMDVFKRDWRWLYRIPARNVASQLGYFLGQRARLLPPALTDRISRDKSLMRK